MMMNKLIKLFPKVAKSGRGVLARYQFHSSKALLSWTPNRNENFFGDYNNLPHDNHYDMIYLEKNEIETRIYKILSSFEKIDLKTFKFSQDLTRDLKLDSLEQTALLTSIEDEFHTVFEDRVFENFKNLEEVVEFLNSDHLVS